MERDGKERSYFNTRSGDVFIYKKKKKKKKKLIMKVCIGFISIEMKRNDPFSH